MADACGEFKFMLLNLLAARTTLAAVRMLGADLLVGELVDTAGAPTEVPNTVPIVGETIPCICWKCCCSDRFDGCRWILSAFVS